MKLVLATPLYPPEPGGPATYARTLVEGLPQKHIEVVLVKFSDVRKLPKGVRHIVYAWNVFIAALDADSVYVLDAVSTGVPAWMAAFLARKPFYLRVAGDYAWEQGTQRFGITETLDEFVERTKLPFPVMVLRALQTFIAKRARKIVVPSEYLKRILCSGGLDPKRIAVVYNAPPVFSDDSHLTKPEQIPSPYVVTVCRLVPWKGVDGIIRAIHILKAKGSPLSVVVVGSGEQEESLRALAEELDVTDRVIFTGALGHGTAPAYVKYAEALVLNTRYEGFSHVILEGFALGVPVLTTPVGGNTEQVVDGESGLLFPFNDAAAIAACIERIADKQLRARLVAGASEKLTSFTLEKVVSGTRGALALI
jgi:glycosyltransferase involved in cell wall biosynthesis